MVNYRACRVLLLVQAAAFAAGAVIQVTAGGSISEPTYMFSDASGNPVATLVANVTDGKITASGVLRAPDLQTSSGASLNSKMDAVISGGPADSPLSISSCTDTNPFIACNNAYDGDVTTKWQTSRIGYPSTHDESQNRSITVTLANGPWTITRFEILQDGHITYIASRVIIEYWDGSGTRLWRGYHDFLLFSLAQAPYVENEEFWIFPRVQGVQSITLTLQGNHPSCTSAHLTSASERIWYRGIVEMKVYGY